MNTTSLCFHLTYISVIGKESTYIHSTIELIIHERLVRDTQLSTFYSPPLKDALCEIYEVEASDRAIEVLRRLEASFNREKCICTYEGKDKKKYISCPTLITDEEKAGRFAYEWLVFTLFSIFTGIDPEMVKASIAFAASKKEKAHCLSLNPPTVEPKKHTSAIRAAFKNMREHATALAADFAAQYMTENCLCTIEKV